MVSVEGADDRRTGCPSRIVALTVGADLVARLLELIAQDRRVLGLGSSIALLVNLFTFNALLSRLSGAIVARIPVYPRRARVRTSDSATENVTGKGTVSESRNEAIGESPRASRPLLTGLRIEIESCVLSGTSPTAQAARPTALSVAQSQAARMDLRDLRLDENDLASGQTSPTGLSSSVTSSISTLATTVGERSAKSPPASKRPYAFSTQCATVENPDPAHQDRWNASSVPICARGSAKRTLTIFRSDSYVQGWTRRLVRLQP